MKANLGKFQFIILGNTGSHTLQIGDITVKSTSSLTLLGITFDSKLNFKKHVNNIGKISICMLYINYMPLEDYESF